MLQITPERRLGDRRSSQGGGRRATDLPSRPSEPPACPMCRESGVAELAGESEGGWWFVCLACDHLWDQRQPASGRILVDEEPMAVATCLMHDARAASFWRRLIARHAHRPGAA